MLSTAIRSLGLFLKKLLGRGNNKHAPVNFVQVENWPLRLSCADRGFVNELACQGDMTINPAQVYPYDNAVSLDLRNDLASKFRTGVLRDTVPSPEFATYQRLLEYFVEQSKIPSPWRYSGLYHAGYSLDRQHYILPSWIWTNGKVVAHLVASGQTGAALDLAARLLELQLPSGGWIVRYDLKDLRAGVSPVIAPNDSAHCADHGLLTAYEVSGDARYLAAAEKCANWIMTEGHDDGLILHGYNSTKERWDTDFNIVDIGFSAGLFCSLYRLTGNRDYLDFAEKFLSRYVAVFYRGNGVFATTLINQIPYGKGIFARGHAWALEGMIPFYELTHDATIGKVIDETVTFLLQSQQRCGGWLYNLRSGPIGWFSGYDNKGIPVIAASLARWKESRPERAKEIDVAVLSSVDWCIRHTRTDAPGKGGIFSCNLEGAVVHSPNTQVGFIYSNCYLLALMRKYGLHYEL